MEWFTVANCINVVLVLVGWSIQNELHHIRESIKDVREMTSKAEAAAAKAHARIDNLLEMRRALKD